MSEKPLPTVTRSPPGSSATMLSLRSWIGLESARVEWGVLGARVLLALVTIVSTFVLEELEPVRLAMDTAAAFVLAYSVLLAWLLRTGRASLEVRLSILLDTVVVGAAFVWGGYLVGRSPQTAAASLAPIAPAPPMLFLILGGVLRLNPLVGALYSVAVPLAASFGALAVDAGALEASVVVSRGAAFSVAGIGFALVSAAIQVSRRQLQASVAEKTRMIATVAHELRGPITAVRTHVDLAREGVGEYGPEQQRELLDRAARAVSRLDDMVEMFAQLERAESAEIALNIDRVNLGEVVADVRRALAPSAAARNVRIELIDMRGLPDVLGDRGAVEQVATNLVSNAIKFSPAGGRVTVRGVRYEREAGIEVEDFGAGISAEDQGRLFERFFRSSDPEKRRVPGTGLGLYISRALLARQSGRIWFTSQEGQGSTFAFVLPLAAADRD